MSGKSSKVTGSRPGGPRSVPHPGTGPGTNFPEGKQNLRDRVEAMNSTAVAPVRVSNRKFYSCCLSTGASCSKIESCPGPGAKLTGREGGWGWGGGERKQYVAKKVKQTGSLWEGNE